MQDAILSGILAAAAAVTVKVASGDYSDVFFNRLAEQNLPVLLLDDSYRLIFGWFVKGLFFCLMVVLNAAMLRCYVKALSSAGTLVGTVINTAVNFLASSFLGWALFNERISFQWWAGATLTLIGVLTIQYAQIDVRKRKPE